MKDEKFWKRILNDDEKIEYEFTIGEGFCHLGLFYAGLLSLLFFAVGGAAFYFLRNIFSYYLYVLFGFIIIGILIFAWALFHYEFYLKMIHSYALTKKRIIICTGYMSVSTESIPYSEITDILVEETFFERTVTKTGTLSLNTAGTTDYEIVLQNIQEPHEIKKKIEMFKNSLEKRM